MDVSATHELALVRIPEAQQKGPLARFAIRRWSATERQRGPRANRRAAVEQHAEELGRMTGPASQPERTSGEAQVAPQPEIAFSPLGGGLDSLGPTRVLALQRTAGNRAVADRLANRPRRPSLARQFPDPVSALAQARRGVVTVVASVKPFDGGGHLVATASLPDAVNPEAVLDIPGGVPLRVQILLGLRQPNQPITWFGHLARAAGRRRLLDRRSADAPRCEPSRPGLHRRVDPVQRSELGDGQRSPAGTHALRRAVGGSQRGTHGCGGRSQR